MSKRPWKSGGSEPPSQQAYILRTDPAECRAGPSRWAAPSSSAKSLASSPSLLYCSSSSPSCCPAVSAATLRMVMGTLCSSRAATVASDTSWPIVWPRRGLWSSPAVCFQMHRGLRVWPGRVPATWRSSNWTSPMMKMCSRQRRWSRITFLRKVRSQHTVDRLSVSIRLSIHIFVCLFWPKKPHAFWMRDGKSQQNVKLFQISGTSTFLQLHSI